MVKVDNLFDKLSGCKVSLKSMTMLPNLQSNANSNSNSISSIILNFNKTKNYILIILSCILISSNSLGINSFALEMSVATRNEINQFKAIPMYFGQTNSNLNNLSTNNKVRGILGFEQNPQQKPKSNLDLKPVLFEMIPTNSNELPKFKAEKLKSTISSSSTNTNTLDSSGFNAGLAVNDQSLYSLPEQFNSPAKIRSYLSSKGSFLANYQVNISFEDDDEILNKNPNLKNYLGQKIDFAQLVWNLSRTGLGDNCTSTGICSKTSQQPINPGFVMAMIQRESGLIYGANANMNPNSEDTQFLVDRATGFTCVETTDKTKSCWDQNPNWKYYKGLFRQTFYMVRNLQLNTKRCEGSGINMYGKTYKVGEIVNHSNKTFELQNGLTCALYIYTPHTFAQKSLYKTMNYLGANSGSYGN